VAGKYDPLQKYLVTRDRGEVRLSLSFDEVGRLVGGLPPSAVSRKTWWANTAASGQAKAWRDAGWLVESADPSAGVVVFARSPTGTPPDPAGPASAAGPAAGGQSAPGAVPEPGKHASWRSMRSGLAACGLAALSGGVAAIISLNHLPSLVIALLSASVAAITFAITQALTSPDAAEKAVKWWSFAMSLVLATGVSAFVYHEELDPSTRPASLPFTVKVSVDPQNPVMSEECRRVVIPGPWRAPTPPTSMTQQAINTWEQAQHGVDGVATYVTIILQGTSSQAVTINAPQVVITSRQRPLGGPVAQMSGGGCGAELQTRLFTVDLDQQQPVATFQDGTGLPAVPSASGAAIEQAQSPVFTISDTDPEYFVVDATVERSLVRWNLDLNWQSMGRSGTLSIGDGSVPFATSAVNPGGHTFYYLRPGGIWSGPS
jgi:hypothetical protein